MESDAVKIALEALRMSKDLLDVVEQTPGNVWHVAADDPETACCDTMSAVEKALADLEQAGEPVADDAREKLAGEQGEQCERCQGNGEIVTDWDRYMHAHDGDVGDEAVADCPDCSGTGRIEDKSAIRQTGLMRLVVGALLARRSFGLEAVRQRIKHHGPLLRQSVEVQPYPIGWIVDASGPALDRPHVAAKLARKRRLPLRPIKGLAGFHEKAAHQKRTCQR